MTAVVSGDVGRSSVRATPDPWLATVLRAVVHALGAAAYTFPLALPETVLAAAAGSAVGAVSARFAARTAARTPVLVAAAFAALALVVALGRLLVTTDAVAGWLGPAGALRLGDDVVFGLGAVSVSFGLRVLAARRPVLALLEAAFVTAAAATLVVAHREGAINRPFDIADPILARGGDPSLAILGIGVATAAVLVLLLLAEKNAGRALLHVAVIAVVLALILAMGQRVGMPEPPKTGAGLGLRDDDSHQGQGPRDPHRRDGLEFRDDYGSSGAQVPVAVVLLHDDYSPPYGTYYFRQSAFSRFNGSRLVEATRADADRDLLPRVALGRTPIPEAPRAGVWRAPVSTTVALLADHSRPFGLEAPIALTPATNRDPGRFRRVYEIDSAALTADASFLLGHEGGSAAWSDDLRHYYVEAPTDPRYRQLAEEIVGRLPEDLRTDTFARALAVTEWLGHAGTYSLRSHHAGATDPTADFLFGDRTGYCVHFAHAAVFLMRELGVPARVATGYAVDESVRQGGSAILLTGGMSHAWPEVYLEGIGWVVTDVAPEHVVDPPPAPPDPDLQRLLGEMARGESPLPVDGSGPQPPLVESAKRAARHAGLLLLGALGAVLAGLYLLKLARRLAPVVAGERSVHRAAYRAALDALAEVSRARMPGESREAFAARVRDLAPSFAALTRAHVAPTFGGARTPRADVRGLLRDVRRELRRTTRLRDRARGAATPWTVFFSR